MSFSSRPFVLAARLGNAMILAAAVTMSGCQITGDIAEIKADSLWVCEAFLPIRPHSSDHILTLSQIREHNAVWDSLCS